MPLIHTGDSTHHHDQVMTPISFSTTSVISAIPEIEPQRSMGRRAVRGRGSIRVLNTLPGYGAGLELCYGRRSPPWAGAARENGKFLLRCGDAKISATDIALGYKQLLEVERGWRDMKQIIDLRPVYHHLEDRIRAHVTLCWLALLLIRITETSTGQTWNHPRAELQRIQLTAGHKVTLKALDLPEPPLVLTAAPATP
jgi:hypothetical protein